MLFDLLDEIGHSLSPPELEGLPEQETTFLTQDALNNQLNNSQRNNQNDQGFSLLVNSNKEVIMEDILGVLVINQDFLKEITEATILNMELILNKSFHKEVIHKGAKDMSSTRTKCS